MADKKPLVAGQSPAVVKQIGSGDVLDVPEIKLGEPLAVQYGGIGLNPTGWEQGRFPKWDVSTGMFTPGEMPETNGALGDILYDDGYGGFVSAVNLNLDEAAGWLSFKGELRVFHPSSSPFRDPFLRMYADTDKVGELGVLSFHRSFLDPGIDLTFREGTIDTAGEFSARKLSVTYNASISQLSSKSASVTINGSKFTITTQASLLAANTSVSFIVTNSQIQDVSAMVFVAHVNGGTIGAYSVSANVAAAHMAVITIRNNTSSALSQSLVLKGVVIG